MKYTDTAIVFSEFPNEISLAINISNCPCHCIGCHSAYLANDIGSELNKDVLKELIIKNDGITCVGFMGGDASPSIVNELAEFVKDEFPKLKTGWYSGRDFLSDKIDIDNFNFIKLGPFIPEHGPLSNKNTNQRFYKIIDGNLIDSTNLFWKKKV